MEPILPDDLLRIPDAAKLIHASTTSTWRYVSTPDKHGVILRSMKVGGKRFTRRAWVEQFIRDSSAAAAKHQ